MEYLSCEMCGMPSYSENIHMQHIFSKKHIQNSRNAVNLDHSIHVTGFTFHTTMKDLYDHFTKFGRVKVVDMIQAHGPGKKVFRKKEGNFRRPFLANKKPNFAFVEFEKAESVEAALIARHHVNGRVIYVNRRQKPVAKEEPVDLEVLQKCASVQDQIQTVHTTLQLTEVDKENREKLRVMVETEMKQYFPSCGVHIFGSSNNGFGVKGCDVDLFLQTGVEAPPPPEDDSDESRKPPDIPTVNQVKNGDVSLEVLNKLTKSGQLQFIRRALLQNRDEYISVVYIPALTCPVVKFLSKTHSLRCDLSNAHSLPLHNTALLQLYSKLDPRVAPLMTVLRRWAKTNDYIGTQPSFSSYTFSLMVIFYLQTRNPPVLPSVNTLRSRPHVKNIVDGFDCSFCSDVSKIERTKNRQSLETLLLDFFAYYKDFYFFEHVISPLTGRCEPKRRLEEAKTEDGKVKANHMYIQDPFDTARNCAGNVKFSVLLTMVDHFRKVTEDFRHKPETDDATNKTWGVAQLLGASSKRALRQEYKRNIFSFNMVMSQKMLQNLREEFATDESQNSLLSQVWVYDVTNIVLDVLRHVLLLEVEIIDAAGSNWYSRKRKLSADDDESSPSKIIRADGVSSVSDNRSMAVSVNGNVPSSKKGAPVRCQNAGGRAPDIRSMSHFAEFVAHSKNASDEPFLCAQVTAYHKTWINRKFPEPELISTGLENVLEDQRNVSLEMVKDAKVKLKNEGKFFCEFYKSCKAGYTILDIKVDPFGMDRSSLQLFKFLKQFMRKIVNSQ